MMRSWSTTDTVLVAPYEAASLPLTLQRLRCKLGRKAKQEREYRFYSLYGLLCRPEVLQAAWKAVKRNWGAAGVDGVSLAMLTANPEVETAFLAAFLADLREQRYRARAVRRVYIPKANGKLRPLGIPTVRDRVVQAAVLLILEPIFEADFKDCSYGFRPGRSAHDALRTIATHLQAGFTAVYDADLAGYFDSIPHEFLLRGLQERLADGAILGLIRQWLRAPVVEPSLTGRPGPGVRQRQGTPQGGVLSPLLANSYLHWFDRIFHGPKGPARWANAKLVRYADDFVVLARYLSADLVNWIEDILEGRLHLKLNREKTKCLDLREPGQSLDFLGYRFRLDRDLHGRPIGYWNVHPSPKALARARERIRELTAANRCFMPMDELVSDVNGFLGGWGAYFGAVGYPRHAFRQLNHFTRERVIGHLQRRSQRGWRPSKDQSLYAHLRDLGLRRL